MEVNKEGSKNGTHLAKEAEGGYGNGYRVYTAPSCRELRPVVSEHRGDGARPTAPAFTSAARTLWT